jgi:F-type H+-transporting ATPase subunit epsilon
MTDMRLRVVTPTRVVLDVTATRVVAESPGGAFGMLPRHVDHVAQLTAGVLVFTDADGTERYLGVNEGTLVKCGRDVLVSTREAIEGDDLSTLEAEVAEAFGALDEEERIARTALARLEAGIVRRFIDLEKAS